MSLCFPKLRPLFAAYTLWLCWATMYLSHHYAVDLVGGSLLATACFLVAKARFLPRVQMDRKLRWDYDYVEIGEIKEGEKEKEGKGRYANLTSFGSDTTLSHHGYDEDDEEYAIGGFGPISGFNKKERGRKRGSGVWTLGSSSSFSSQASSINDRSPGPGPGPGPLGAGEGRDSWEVETLAGSGSGSDHEKR